MVSGGVTDRSHFLVLVLQVHSNKRITQQEQQFMYFYTYSDRELCNIVKPLP